MHNNVLYFQIMYFTRVHWRLGDYLGVLQESIFFDYGVLQGRIQDQLIYMNTYMIAHA